MVPSPSRSSSPLLVPLVVTTASLLALALTLTLPLTLHAFGSLLVPMMVDLASRGLPFEQTLRAEAT